MTSTSAAPSSPCSREQLCNRPVYSGEGLLLSPTPAELLTAALAVPLLPGARLAGVAGVIVGKGAAWRANVKVGLGGRHGSVGRGHAGVGLLVLQVGGGVPREDPVLHALQKKQAHWEGESDKMPQKRMPDPDLFAHPLKLGLVSCKTTPCH